MPPRKVARGPVLQGMRPTVSVGFPEGGPFGDVGRNMNALSRRDDTARQRQANSRARASIPFAKVAYKIGADLNGGQAGSIRRPRLGIKQKTR